ncbi:FAD-dependent oxidoreductase [Brevibacterium sp. UCMA 11754]|uniref:FAD-dependent oxidoreductase n=1 Tax=Brevibacterium sp. UCMA 11754 TaxID=2749198 RepID=UPI001F2FFEBF|nr:FAD-dependent oxidoreductase [Brevibacterium sp. UCMA 11754]MCF2573857.1 FAD-dependent oxidoreductase [Brevibacterium sp. UCMA 11754]
MSVKEHQVDLVVLGTGIAGQTVATTAAEAGLSVALLEKTDARGGSSVMSGGYFAFSGTQEQTAHGEHDDRELFLKDLLDVGDHLNRTDLLEVFLDRQDETYRWLKDHGVEFREISISSGQSAKRSHLSEIKDVIAGLHCDFENAGGLTYMEHRAHTLVRGPRSRVTGVVAASPQGDVRFSSRGGVVLATGGFSRGTDMLRAFAPYQLNAIPYGGRGNTGDGLRMAWKLGAGMADMSFVSGTYGSHPETGEEFHELLTAYYQGAIIVNRAGRRFTDESQSYKTLGRDVLEQPEGLGFEIFDATVRAQSEPGVPLKDIDALEDIGHVLCAQTLEELARAAGIDADALVKTVAEYNAAIGEDTDEFGRTSLCNGVGDPAPIVQAPFYAYPAKSLMTTTYCGLTVTPDAEVTDVDGDIIDGLFGVGEVIGGFHGAAYMTGSSLAKGAVFGHAVGQRIATELTDETEGTE